MKLLVPFLSKSVFMWVNDDNAYHTNKYGFTMGHALIKSFSTYLEIKRDTQGLDQVTIMAFERFSIFDWSFVPSLVFVPKQNDVDIIEMDDRVMYCTKDFRDDVIEPLRDVIKNMNKESQ